MPADTRPFPVSIHVLINHLRGPRGYLIEDDVKRLVSWIEGEPTRLAQARAEGYREGIEAAARCVEGGRFLHDDAPTARFAREAAKAIRALTPPPAEPAQHDDGWIEWKGGECPVPVGTLVEVRFRSGEVHVGEAGASLDWAHADVANGGGALSGWDVIAYRIVKPASAPVAPDEDSASACPYCRGCGLLDAGGSRCTVCDGAGVVAPEDDDQSRIAALEAENAALREALRPFAEDDVWHASIPDDFRAVNPGYTIGDLRRARALLQGGSDAG